VAAIPIGLESRPGRRWLGNLGDFGGNKHRRIEKDGAGREGYVDTEKARNAKA